MASLDDIDDESDSDSSAANDQTERPVERRETSETQVGNATAPVVTAEPPPNVPIVAPDVAAKRPQRTRAGRGGSNKNGTSASSSEGSSEEGEEHGQEEPFRLPDHIYRSIVDEATRDAAPKAGRLVLEDIGFSAHVAQLAADEVMRRLHAAKINEVERTPTQAAVLETNATPVEDVVDAEVVEVIEEVSSAKEKPSTTETPKKANDDGNGILIAIIVVIAVILFVFFLWPSSHEHRSNERQTTSESDDTEADETAAVSAAQPIASSTSPTPEAIEAFTSRAPYLVSERLILLRQLRGTGSEDMRDMNCEGTGMNFSSRTFAERTVNGVRDSRPLSQSEAQAYFADPGHTGQLTVDAEGGPRHYTVFFDVRDRPGETGHCDLLIDD